MKTILITLALMLCANAQATTFADLLGKGTAAADAWLGKANILADGARDYTFGGYGFTLYYEGARLTKITIPYFPAGKNPKTPQDVAKMIGPDIRVGTRTMRGILEHYFCHSESGVWEMLLTPGDNGYSVVNITPP